LANLVVIFGLYLNSFWLMPQDLRREEAVHRTGTWLLISSR
jgi:hypothetical protein